MSFMSLMPVREMKAVLGALAALSVASIALGPETAFGQKADAGLTGLARGDEVIMARQLLMDGNETAMMSIDLAAGGKAVPLPQLQAEAYLVFSYMTAFPHLFPPQTKPIAGPDGSPSASSATMAVWDDFEAFYSASMEAANIAFDASQAKDLAGFVKQAKALRTSCDSCHETYMHVQDYSGAAPK